MYKGLCMCIVHDAHLTLCSWMSKYSFVALPSIYLIARTSMCEFYHIRQYARAPLVDIAATSAGPLRTGYL